MFDDLSFKVIRINSRDEVIALCSHPMVGSAAYEIARQLYVSEATVKTHINSLLSKLNVSDRTQAATTALQRGIVHLD